MGWDAFGCLGLLALAGFLFYLLVAAPRRRQIEELGRRIATLSGRVAALERRSVEPTQRAEGAPSPSPVPEPPKPQLVEAPRAPTASEWIDVRPPAIKDAAEPPPLPRAVEPPPSRVASRAAAARSEVSFETFLGGRVLLVVGVVVVLFGLAFFLKYAIDHGWVNPAARVTMGALAGVALLFGGDKMRRRGFDVFGQALMGCGLGALYLSNFYACTQYGFISRPLGFAVAAGVTVVGASLAVWRDAPVLAHLGFLGGYLAPLLLGDRTGTLPALTGWLWLLDAGVLAVTLRRAWNGLELTGLIFTAFYVAAWLQEHARALPISTTVACACVGALVASSLAKGLAPAMVRGRRPSGLSLLCVAGASILGVAAWHTVLAPDAFAVVGALTLALAAVCAGAAWYFERRVYGARVASESLRGLAAAAVVTAIIEIASGEAVAPALSAVGVAIVFAGARGRYPVLVAAGLASIGLAFVDLVAHRTQLFNETMTPFFNRRLVLFETPCVALVAASMFLRRAKAAMGPLPTLVAAAGYWIFAVVLVASVHADLSRGGASSAVRDTVPVIVAAAYGLAVALLALRNDALGRVLAVGPTALSFVLAFVLVAFRGELVSVPFFDLYFAAGFAPCLAAFVAARQPEAWLRSTLRVVALVWLFCLVTVDLFAWGDHGTFADLSREELRFRAQVGVSVAWAIYAAALVAAGFWRRSAPTRWTGLAVFALTLAKVFLVDMAQLEAVYRIGSFLVLGALLVGASFLYQRSRGEAPRDL